MARGLNKVMLIGQLGRAPEMRYTPRGKPVTSFSIVITHRWITSDGQRREETDWFNVVAEECKEQLCKGQQVYIEGRVKTRSWTDENEIPRSCAEVVAQDVIPLQGVSTPAVSPVE